MSQKNVFWQAFIITVFIFGIGIFLGIVLENWRAGKINDLYQESDLNILDIKLQSEIYSLKDFNCKNAVSENIKFADKIFEEAKLLEKYENAKKLSDSLSIQHKKYDLLRTNLFLNSIKIKEKCKNSYYEVVYFYDFNEPSFNTKAKQEVFSKLLLELKEQKGEEILLIPISGDNNLTSVNILLDKYNIITLPTILIDRNNKITEIQNIEELLKYFD